MENQRKQMTPEEDALEHIAACRDKAFLEGRYIDSFKGRGVFTHKAVKPSTFVVEYRGSIFSHKDTRPKTKCGGTLNNYLFEFSWEGAHWCIDASKEDGSFGRLVNDDHISPNCEMKTVVYEGKPHVCLFAVKEISPGEEITYNYGDSFYPWRSVESYERSSASHTAATSAPRNERYADFDAASSFEISSSDDDDERPASETSHENESFASVSSRCGFRETSPTDDFLDFQEMTEIFTLQPDDASCTLQDDEASFSLNKPSYIRDNRRRRATRKPGDSSYSTRLNYCYVCGAGCTKFARHLLRHAGEEPDIAEAFALPKMSKERKRLLEDLRNRGNYKHNQEVLKNKSGKLKARRQPTNVEVTHKTHVHCLYCKGMFKRREMWRHVARCPSRTMSDSSTDGKKRVLGEIALAESTFSHKITSGVWKMLLHMKQDEIAFAVQNDFLIIQLAQCLSKKHGNNPVKHELIRQRLRELGRLLLALHEKSIFSFEEATKPRNFYKVVEAVKDVAGFNEKMQSYKKPTLALKLGHSLKKMGFIVLTGVDGNEQMRREMKTFMKLCAKEWSQLVSKTASASLSGRKVNNPSTIPFTRDVQVLYSYLERTSASATEGLKMQESPEVYNALCRVTLSQVAVLNKCAPEVSKMTLKQFQERDDTTRVLSKHFIRINILSKAGQNVAVLLTSQLVSAITLLVSKREACGVHPGNPFLFAKPNSSSTSLYHGGNCIRAFSALCRAKNPEHLRSVHLHKHIARVFQILNLENDELHHLAKLLGHDIRADRDYYRSPEAAVELAKIAKLLLAMEKGSLERFRGNSLEEIEIEDELEPDVEQGNPERSEAEEDDEEQSTADAVKRRAAVETQTRQLTPERDAEAHIKACRDKPFLEEMFIDSLKGRGVFTRESIEPSTFVVEYRGNIFSHKDTRTKKSGDTLNNYVFDFSWSGTNWRVDASKEDGSLGRLVNDDHISPNCEIKTVVCEGKPHLCLFALREISPGEEITYNYGSSSYPWRSTGSSGEVNASQMDLNVAECLADDESAEDSAGSCSDDEYVPDGELSSDDGSSSRNNERREDFKSSRDPDTSKASHSFVQQRIEASPTKEESDDSAGDFTSGGEFDDASQATRNYCYICGKAQTKISRHLFTHRKAEPEIAQVFALPLYSKERSRLLDKLRNRGNYKHNQEVLRTRRGKLKVKRRMTNTSCNAKTYALCLYCKVMFCRWDLWRHMQKCSSKESSASPRRGRNKVLTLVAAAESTDSEKVSKDVAELLKEMKKDEIASVVCNDSHILQLAQWLCQMNESKQRNHETLRQRLRLMGRLLITLRKKSIHSFEDAVKPQNFTTVAEAVMELAGFNEDKKSFQSPSLRMKLGNSLKKISEIHFARAMKDDADKQKIEEAETFMNLCAKEWGYAPPVKSSTSSPTIPFIHDVQLLYRCMEETADSAAESLTMYESPPVYNALLRVTVAQVAVMNKNMSEVSKATLKSFSERDEAALHKEAAVCSSQLDQILCKQSVKINVRSTGGKKLVVTLTPKLLAAVTLLVSKRESCGVHKNNPFLFARPVDISISFYRGYQCVNTFVARCGAKNAVSLRSLLFRKHVARIFRILSLTSEDLDELARLLGRDIRTDREYYQTPEAAGDIAKILQLLSAVEHGSLGKLEGKPLEEIEIAGELEPDVGEENLENSEAEEENEESERLLNPNGRSSSETKTTGRGSSSRGRGRGSRRRQESESEASELNDEAHTDRDDWSEEAPPSEISLSDDDEGVNVDFGVDTDEDSVRNDGEGDTSVSAAEPLITNIQDKTKRDNDRSDTRRSGGSRSKQTEKKNRLSAAVAGIKDVKILIPKLDIDKLQEPVHVSELPSVFNSVKWPAKEQPVCDADSQSGLKNKPSSEKVIQMTCSHCKKTMMKGQTAYQKKGFTDVFCSKNCLFEMFPGNTPAAKTCHKCQRAISQPLDLIMAAVDTKGTMKDFCSITCLSSFRSCTLPAQTPPSICSMCMKSCTTTRELTLSGAVHKFCSDSCSEGYRRDHAVTCENCSSACRRKPLTLKLEEESKIICSEECLSEFKEKITASQQCTMCRASKPASDMVHHKSGGDLVELFCTRACVTSYSLRPTDAHRPGGAGHVMSLNGEGACELDAPSLRIAKSVLACDLCGNKLLRGKTVCQSRNSSEAFCSFSCFTKYHAHFKRCHNCFQLITRPHDIILAPVDDSGTMRELCSNTCLSSVNSKRSVAVAKPPRPAGRRSECRMCARFCFCKYKLTLDGLGHKICSDACFVKYHEVNSLSVFTCDVCGSFIRDQQLMMKVDGGSKTICGEECLVKFKEKAETRRLCPMCQTSHRMSDMVEIKNAEGSLDFFCSSRCMMVHKAQSVAVSERNSPSLVEDAIKEVKPLPKLDCIKEEPMDEESTPDLSSCLFTNNIKDEPNVATGDLKIGSVFSLTEDSTSAASALARMRSPAPCSNCSRGLMDGETVYQTKGDKDMFCSTSCLLTFYQVKQAKKTCHFCLQTITQTQGVLQAMVDTDETVKDFCSQTCLSSFNYQRIMSTRIPLAPVASQSQCSVCSRYCISKREIIQQDVIHKICGDPCFHRFCNMNGLSICESCRSHCRTPVVLRVEGCSKKLCSAHCLSQLKQKIKTRQPCALCSTPHLVSDMVESKNSEGEVELFCTQSCVMASKIQAVSASGVPFSCDNCAKAAVPACHLATSDASIRNFCSLACAMAFKETQGAATGASDQTPCDFLKPPEKLPCAQCRRILKTAPKVVQKKGKMNFVCSLACSQEFKRVNNIMGKCEYCENDKIIREARRVNDKDCYFCSDGCLMLFGHELGKKWGEYCQSCAYCLSVSKTVVTAQYRGAEEKFCSEECSSNYNMLFCHVAKCDTCGREGKLRQGLPMLGEVKHFCDLKCLLHFCNKKVQTVSTVSSPPRSAGTAESSPVIADVISLAGILARNPSTSAASAQHASVSGIQAKVVGHASVQTVSKELKNKSMLCTPLVHNKGVSCTTQTAAEAQTDNFGPRVVVLPVPVPVYVPLPMNMYSQYAPKPVGLPLPLPVPVFVPVTPDRPEPTGASMKERIQPDSEKELGVKESEVQDEKTEDGPRHREVTEGDAHTLSGKTFDDSGVDHQAAPNNQEESDASSVTRPHAHEQQPDSEPGRPTELPPPAPPPAPAPPPVGNVHHVNKLQQLSKTAKEEASHGETVSRRRRQLKSRHGIEAWKRWIQRRESGTNLDPVSSGAVAFEEDVLRCSAAELSDGLCRFIKEARRRDGGAYSPDRLFYLCLSMQQYLFENGRLENIFSDPIYNKFSSEFTEILRGFKPSAAAGGRIHSCVEEEFLWDCKQLGAYSPIVLLNTLLFFCCKYFGFTTVEQHRRLSFAHIMRCTKTNPNKPKTTFLRFYPPISINEAESDADGVPAKKRRRNDIKEKILEMTENTENPLRCPIRLYELYLSKCSEVARQCSNLFYLNPDPTCVPSSPLWFSSRPLDSATMEAMLLRILNVRELRRRNGRGLDQQVSHDTSPVSDEEDSE